MTRISRRPHGRRILIVLGVIAASLVVTIGIAYVAIDPIVRRAIRSYLQDTLDTPVRLRSVRILLAGGARIEGLTVLNPPGFREREAFHLQSLEAVSPATAAFRNPIVVQEVLIRQPEFIIEFGEEETNWAALIRNASRELEKEKEEPSDGPGLGFVVRNVQIVQPVLRIAPTKLFPDGLLLRFRDVTLERIGNTPDSPTPFYLAVAILIQAILTGETSDGTAIPSAVRSRLGDELLEGGRAITEALGPGP